MPVLGGLFALRGCFELCRGPWTFILKGKYLERRHLVELKLATFWSRYDPAAGWFTNLVVDASVLRSLLTRFFFSQGIEWLEHVWAHWEVL